MKPMPSVTPALSVPLAAVDARDEQVWNDGALAAPVHAPSARLWRYRAPAVVLGRSQRGMLAVGPVGPVDSASGSVSESASGPAIDSANGSVDSASESGSDPAGAAIEVVDRDAGGGAVLVGPWMLGVSVVLPSAHRAIGTRPVAASYDWFGQALATALRRHGVAARVAADGDARKPPAGLEWACFAGVTIHEVLVDRRKIVGLAQRRTRHGVLFVAGVLVAPVPWLLLAGAMTAAWRHGRPGRGPATVAPPPAQVAGGLAAETVSAAEVAPRPLPIAAIAASVGGALATVIGSDALQPATGASPGMLASTGTGPLHPMR
jgi:lipoate-protein ligase A